MIAYSEAIWGCTHKDAPHAISAIRLLIKSLNHENQKVLSSELQKAYVACIDLIKKRKFDIAIALLQALRDAWKEANIQIDG